MRELLGLWVVDGLWVGNPIWEIAGLLIGVPESGGTAVKLNVWVE